MIDIDDSICAEHGDAKLGAGFGYTRVRGLNSAITTIITADRAPVIAAQHLRKGACRSARAAHRPITDFEAIFDEDNGQWVRRCRGSRIAFTAFASKPKAQQITGRLVVRRIHDLQHGEGTGPFDVWRFHAFSPPVAPMKSIP